MIMRKKFLLLIPLFISAVSFLQAQGKFYTKTGRISFYSTTAMENIEAINKSAVTLLDTKTGDLQFVVLVKGFEFKKALMQEHFNKEYAETDTYPRAEFKGIIRNNTVINYTANGRNNVTVKGKLTIHGVAKDVETTGSLEVKDGKLIIHSVFNILIADYKITIPRLYRDNISSTIRITVDCSLEPLK
jgi:polyisoprenoid-binding protein YceI